MPGWWRRRLLKPPLPSEFIGRYLDGKVTHDEFASSIGEGWIGSNIADRTWLDEVYSIERQHNPDFPNISLDSFKSDAALDQLRSLRSDFLSRGL